MQLLGVAAGCPWTAVAQTSAKPIIGFLHSASPGPFEALVAAFKEGLAQGGYINDQNVTIHYSWAHGQEDQLKPEAVNLVNRPVDLIVALGGMRSAEAARAATATIPILFIAGSDPIRAGLVSSLARPGGNATGISNLTTEMLGKRLELLREITGRSLPGDAKIAILVTSAPVVQMEEMEFAEKNSLVVIKHGAGRDFDRAEYDRSFDSAVKSGARALLISADPFFTNARKLIVELAAKHALPAIYPWREYVETGGLGSYGPNITDEYRQIGGYAARILRGQKPMNLPVQQPAKFDMVINSTTLKALGLTLSRITRARAIELIE